MEMVLTAVGAASFVGYLIWLIISSIRWDSKIPPIIGMLLSLVMLVGGLSALVDIPGVLNSLKPKAPPPLDLTGEWKQVNSRSDTDWQTAVISGGRIEVYWVSRNGELESLYWAGTYVPPATGKGSYSWDSENAREEASSSVFASNEDVKTFTYKRGQLSFSASVMGVETTVKLERLESLEAGEPPSGEGEDAAPEGSGPVGGETI